MSREEEICSSSSKACGNTNDRNLMIWAPEGVLQKKTSCRRHSCTAEVISVSFRFWPESRSNRGLNEDAKLLEYSLSVTLWHLKQLLKNLRFYSQQIILSPPSFRLPFFLSCPWELPRPHHSPHHSCQT